MPSLLCVFVHACEREIEKKKPTLQSRTVKRARDLDKHSTKCRNCKNPISEKRLHMGMWTNTRIYGIYGGNNFSFFFFFFLSENKGATDVNR